MKESIYLILTEAASKQESSILRRSNQYLEPHSQILTEHKESLDIWIKPLIGKTETNSKTGKNMDFYSEMATLNPVINILWVLIGNNGSIKKGHKCIWKEYYENKI